MSGRIRENDKGQERTRKTERTRDIGGTQWRTREMQRERERERERER